MKTLRPLEELLERSSLALANNNLVDLASKLSPTAAYEAAYSQQFKDEQVISCRYLAILRRDYGEDAFASATNSVKENSVDRLFETHVIPAITLMEQILGGQMRIVQPEDRGLTLIEYLRLAKPAFLNLGLEVGDYKLAINRVLNRTESCWFEYGHKLTAPDGSVISERQMKSSSHEVSNQLSLRNQLAYHLYHHLLGFAAFPHNSLLIDVVNWLEKQGETVLPRLGKIEGLRQQIITGNVARVEMIIDKVRSSYSDAKPWAKAVFECEVQGWLNSARRNQRKFDIEMPLVEKLRDGTLHANYEVIPGNRAGRTYSFLTCGYHFVHENLVRILTDSGYAGSLAVGEFNLPNTSELLSTGQFDGLIFYQANEDNIQDALHGLKDMQKPPMLVVDDINRTAIAAFLREHFPLN